MGNPYGKKEFHNPYNGLPVFADPYLRKKYYTPDNKLVEHEAHSTWAALIQHEYDHLDGILYPMQMRDFSYFGYNDSPGDIARDAIKNKESIDPLFLDLVKKWPE